MLLYQSLEGISVSFALEARAMSIEETPSDSESLRQVEWIVVEVRKPQGDNLHCAAVIVNLLEVVAESVLVENTSTILP